MNHMALYRAWRPQTFKDIVGQEHITKTLQNALREGRFSHAYLFNGPRGTGKTSAAKVLAKAVNCEKGPSAEPCNACESCQRISKGAVMDVVEIDAASNRGVEEIREIRDKVKYAPTEVRIKVYIIDEVHMLTTEAFNALLKTLEEPPEHVVFILATTEPFKLPATIISRCQRFDFHRIPLSDQIARIRFVCEQEQLSIEDEALHYIARLSDGGMRDALSLLDQISSFSNGLITYADVLALTGGVSSDQFSALALHILNHSTADVLRQIDQMMQEGKSAERCIEGFIQYIRDVMVHNLAADYAAQTQHNAEYPELLVKAQPTQLFEMIEILNHYQVEMKYAAQPRTMLEVALLKCCSLHQAVSEPKRETVETAASLSSDIQEQLIKLERKITELERRVDSGKVMEGGSTRLPNLGTSTVVDKEKLSQAVTSRKGFGEKLDSFIKQKNETVFSATLSAWAQILNQVKDQKITVHAWLVDGEPVSATDDAVLVAFKNTIHRETTEKPVNKQLIEQVMDKVLQKPVKLVTVLQKDWQQTSVQPSSQPAEELKLEPEADDEGKYKEDWINEAIDLFGEDLVKIKEES